MTLAFYGVEGLSKGYLNKPIDIGHFEIFFFFDIGHLALSMAAYLPQVYAVCILNVILVDPIRLQMQNNKFRFGRTL